MAWKPPPSSGTQIVPAGFGGGVPLPFQVMGGGAASDPYWLAITATQTIRYWNENENVRFARSTATNSRRPRLLVASPSTAAHRPATAALTAVPANCSGADKLLAMGKDTPSCVSPAPVGSISTCPLTVTTEPTRRYWQA